MAEIGGKNIAGSGYNLWDWLAVGISKRTTESLLQPVIGNGTLKSGALKIGAALAGDMVRPKGGMVGKFSEYAVAGLVVDGVEDITLALLGANPLGSLMGQQNSSQTNGIYI